MPYLYSLSYMATQCINNMNRVTKCRFTLLGILLCKWGIKIRGNCLLRCHVYMISKPLIRKYVHVVKSAFLLSNAVIACYEACMRVAMVTL